MPLELSLATLTHYVLNPNDANLANDINESIENNGIEIDRAIGKALHRLHEIKPSKDALKKLVQDYPNALLYEDAYGWLPIQTAADESQWDYIPILVEEGNKHNVGGKGMRGGLLMEIDETTGIPILTELVSLNGKYKDDAIDEEVLVSICAALKDLNLLVQTDVAKYNLLFWSLNSRTKAIFNILADLDPESLKTLRKDALKEDRKGDGWSFEMIFDKTFQHFPQELGLLNHRIVDNGITLYQLANQFLSTDRVSEIISKFFLFYLDEGLVVEQQEKIIN